MKTKSKGMLTPQAVDSLRQVGENIRTARLRRGWSRQELGMRAGAHESTIKRLEEGRDSTTIGVMAGVLWVLGLIQDMVLLAKPENDSVGVALARRTQRKRGLSVPPAQEMDNEF